MKNLYIILITVFFFQIETKLTAQNPLPVNPKNINTEAEVGTLSGTFAVGQTGAATYTIPIDLPEGRVGMTPELGLVYSSQQGNNILGQGWHISGFSSISRTNPTTYYNGEIDNVDFDGDQFVLDGQRLIVIEDRGNEIEYRTEIDGISKIIYYKIYENHHFKVYTKSGLIKEYGYSQTSKQYYEPGNDDGIPLIWHLNKIFDRKGNTINYIYVQTPNYGEIHPSRIEYTGYEVDGKRKDKFGFYAIDFTYDDNNVPAGLQRTAYFEKNGQKYLNRNIKRLNQITISYLSTTIKIYKFTYYEDKGVTNEFFLKDVTLQVQTDQGFKSLNPTVFSWDFYLPQYNKIPVSQNFPIKIPESPPVKMKKFDYNGDGKDEIIVYKEEYDPETYNYDKNIYIYSRYFYDFIIPISSLNYYYGEFNGADFDNNGDDELIVSDDNGFSIYDFIKEPSGNYWYYEEVYHSNESGKPKALDINGDGLSDCFLISGNQGTLYLGTGDPNNFFIEDNPPIFIPPHSNFYIHEYSDFNGDGKIDILTKQNNSNNFRIYSFNENNNTFEEISNLYLFNNDNIYFNDFNGDGKTDICHLINNDTEEVKKIYFSYGDGFIDYPEIIETNDFPDFGYPIIADFNNDNRADFIFIWYIDQGPLGQDEKTLYLKVFYTQPDGLHHVYSYNEEYLMGENINTIAALTLADITGNGSMDFAIEFREYGQQGPYNDYLHLYYFTDNNNGNFIKTIENGFGSQLNITYMPFNTSYVNTSYNYPLSKLVAKTYLVDEVWQINESGEKINHQKFTFTNPLMHKAGKGFLGFQNTTIKNYQNNTITSAEFSIFAENDLYFHPYPENIKQHSFINNQRETDKLLMETYNTFNIKTTITDKPKIYLPVITQSLQKVWDNDDNNTFIKTVKTIQIIDDIDIYGNILKNTVLADPSFEPGSNFDFKTIVENSYIIDVDNWLVGRPLSSEGTNSYINDNEDNFVRTDYTYYQEGEATWPLLKFKKITPNYDPKYRTEAWYEYDEYGNITKETLRVQNSVPEPPIITRETDYEYTTDNGYNARFLTKKINKINGVEYATQYEYYKEIGKLKKEIVLGGPVLLETTYEYDDFGKLFYTVYPDQTTSSNFFLWSEGDPDAPQNALFHTFSYQTGEPFVTVFYDKFERELRTVTIGFNAITTGKTYVDKYYNSKAQLWKVSEPYFSSSLPQQWTVFEYDKLGRKKTTITPANSYTYDYCGKTTTTINNGTQISVSKTVNTIGNIESVVDPAGPVYYEYNSSGNVKSINALGSIYSMEYDPAGNQNKLIDPNAGTITYKYNPFGELIEQTDARDNTYIMIYDDLGRLHTKTLQNTNETTTYIYNDEAGTTGFGNLTSITGHNGIVFSYEYDNLNRLISKTESFNGTDYTTGYEYNNDGKLTKYTYPSGFSIKYHYVPFYGFLYLIIDAATNNILWEADEVNQRGQLTDFTLGNGLSTHKDFDDYGLPKTIITGNVQDLEYSFDPVTGNLNYRKDHIFNLVENFEYDNLLKTRLIEWEVYGLDNYSIEYENNGNIHIKTDVTNIQTLPKGEYVYGQNAGQHAVTSIFKPTEEYLLKATPPQTIEYTPFNKTKSISKTVIEHDKTHIYRMDISYGPYQKRKATQFYKDKTLLSSKCFIGDNYEIETERDGTKRKLHYLSGGDGLFAIYESKDGENKMYYIHKDYLGSYETVTDEQGVIWDKLSFDPWGRRRNPFTWLYEDTPIPAIFDRGYTGHEHLDKFELINMGGRVYDPVLARFLSPDPFVQAPEYGQNYNRYSYAFNNPLKFTDPNGEFGFLIFVGLSALMSAALSGSQPDGSFDWGEAGKGAFIGVAMPVGMMGSVLAPFSPALLGVSGALGSAAIAGSAMFGSVTLTTGATSFATNGTFSPNLKAAGISAGITALFAGIEGGIRAANDNRNFWTGEIEIDPFIIGKQDVQSSYLNTAQKYNSSAARETHDKLLKLRYEDTFSFKDGDFDISKLTTGTSRKIGYTPSGSFINTKTGELYAGYFNRATKAIHISLKTLSSKDIIFKSIAGHELIHAYHHSIIPNMLSLYTERVAYQYTYNVLMMGGEYKKAMSKFWYMSIKGYFGEYPASYNLPTYYSFW